MGKFSSNAASALDKVLKRKTLVQLQGFVSALAEDIKQKKVETEHIEAEARRILDIKYYVSGAEIINQGPLANNLVKSLDEEDLVRALGVATSVRNQISAERQAWLVERKKIHESFENAPRWKESMENLAGPGVAIPPIGRKP